MFKKIKEWYSMQWAKNPERMIVLNIALFNVCFLIIASVVIRYLAPDGPENMNFWNALFYTLTMILDAGCITFVTSSLTDPSALIIVVFVIVVIIGMVAFTGAVIGAFTNAISKSIEKSNSGSNKLHISNHMVILNWNTRASEIINDLLYNNNKKQRIVVLTDRRKDEITKEINDRIDETVSGENALLKQNYKKEGMNILTRSFMYLKHRMKKNLFVIVREGDVFSSKQLNDICLERAQSVVILGDDINNSVCKLQQRSLAEIRNKGNAQTIKTLMQVSEITGSENSDDRQRIIVEITEDWTNELVERIIKNKKIQQNNNNKCNIVPVCVNKILGQLLAQFSLMPELNLVYKTLFSNYGASFYSAVWDPEKWKTNSGQTVKDAEACCIDYCLKNHENIIPLYSLKAKDGGTKNSKAKYYFYFVADNADSASKVKKSIEEFEKNPKAKASNTDKKDKSDAGSGKFSVSLKNFNFRKKCIIILGHNIGCSEIMNGFKSFCNKCAKFDRVRNPLDIVVIDDKEHLDRVNGYEDFGLKIRTYEASIYDKNIIIETLRDTIDDFIGLERPETTDDISVLILSDDTAPNESIDVNALANLVFVQDIITEKLNDENDPDFDVKSIDPIIELIDPRHHDVVSSYGSNNAVISNRYISKMITQISEKEEIFDLFKDILTYDYESPDSDDDDNNNEIYIKKASDFFETIPQSCTASQLVREVHKASKAANNPAMLLGYVRPGVDKQEDVIKFFCGNKDKKINLQPQDKLIVFAEH